MKIDIMVVSRLYTKTPNVNPIPCDARDSFDHIELAKIL